MTDQSMSTLLQRVRASVAVESDLGHISQKDFQMLRRIAAGCYTPPKPELQIEGMHVRLSYETSIVPEVTLLPSVASALVRTHGLRWQPTGAEERTTIDVANLLDVLADLPDVEPSASGWAWAEVHKLRFALKNCFGITCTYKPFEPTSTNNSVTWTQLAGEVMCTPSVTLHCRIREPSMLALRLEMLKQVRSEMKQCGGANTWDWHVLSRQSPVKTCCLGPSQCGDILHDLEQLLVRSDSLLKVHFSVPLVREMVAWACDDRWWLVLSHACAGFQGGPLQGWCDHLVANWPTCRIPVALGLREFLYAVHGAVSDAAAHGSKECMGQRMLTTSQCQQALGHGERWLSLAPECVGAALHHLWREGQVAGRFVRRMVPEDVKRWIRSRAGRQVSEAFADPSVEFVRTDFVTIHRESWLLLN